MVAQRRPSTGCHSPPQTPPQPQVRVVTSLLPLLRRIGRLVIYSQFITITRMRLHIITAYYTVYPDSTVQHRIGNCRARASHPSAWARPCCSVFSSRCTLRHDALFSAAKCLMSCRSRMLASSSHVSWDASYPAQRTRYCRRPGLFLAPPSLAVLP